MRRICGAGVGMAVVLCSSTAWGQKYDGSGSPTFVPHTLQEALAAAYLTNPTLQEARATLRATDEQVPTALAGWRPTVTGTVGLTYYKGVNDYQGEADDPTLEHRQPWRITTRWHVGNKSRYYAAFYAYVHFVYSNPQPNGNFLPGTGKISRSGALQGLAGHEYCFCHSVCNGLFLRNILYTGHEAK